MSLNCGVFFYCGVIFILTNKVNSVFNSNHDVDDGYSVFYTL